MSNPNSPNVIAGMLSIHAIVSRSLRVALERSEAFVQHGVPDARSHEGFIDYLRCLVSVLNAHHQTEDTLAFPSFREQVDAPYDLLTEQHGLLHPMLEQARTIIEEAADASRAAEPLARLYLVLRDIEELWHPHIGIEEEHFTVDRFAALMPPDEHLRLIGLFLDHTRQLTGPDYLILPFLIYNLEPRLRAIFAAEMPPIVTEQLVPVVWKEKWAPMQPFLLA
jgi:hypothetical protein